MGISPDAPRRIVETLPRLGAQTAWVRMSHIPFFMNDIAVEHRGVTETTLTNQSGPDLQWKASFSVNGPSRILIDGAPVPVTMDQRPGGQQVASAVVSVPSGRRRVAIVRS
jgi:hypothetical protein